MKDLYFCIHDRWHESPVAWGAVNSDHAPKDDEIIRALGFELERDKGDYITVFKVDNIKTLPSTLL